MTAFATAPQQVPTISSTSGGKSQEDIRRAVTEHMRPHLDALARDGVTWGPQLLESVNRSDFSFAATRESLRNMNAGRVLAETITLSQIASAINLSTVNDVFNDYEAFPALYEQIAEIHPSTQYEEEYPEEWADDLPIKTSELEEAPESRLSGNSYRIRNYTYARILAISRKAFDNDARGVTKRRAANFAQNYKRVIDRAFINSLFRQLTPDNPNMPSTNVLGQNSIVGSTPGPITPQRLQDGITLAAFITDIYGEYVTFRPDTLVVDSYDELNALRFLTSLYSPTGFGAGSAGYNVDTAPGAFSTNILQGRLQVAHSPYVKATRAVLGTNGLPALLMKSKLGHVVQIKQDLQIEMEPNAGRSFDTRSYRWQGTLEFGTGNRNPRLFIVLN